MMWMHSRDRVPSTLPSRGSRLRASHELRLRLESRVVDLLPQALGRVVHVDGALLRIGIQARLGHLKLGAVRLTNDRPPSAVRAALQLAQQQIGAEEGARERQPAARADGAARPAVHSAAETLLAPIPAHPAPAP